jgi:hypothetical protein
LGVYLLFGHTSLFRPTKKSRQKIQSPNLEPRVSCAQPTMYSSPHCGACLQNLPRLFAARFCGCIRHIYKSAAEGVVSEMHGGSKHPMHLPSHLPCLRFKICAQTSGNRSFCLKCTFCIFSARLTRTVRRCKEMYREGSQKSGCNKKVIFIICSLTASGTDR